MSYDQTINRILEIPEVQRLRHVRYLGLAHLVYPGGNYSRLDHLIWTSRLAQKVAENVLEDPKEKIMIQVAALLHDIGHGPFSHVTENVFERLLIKKSYYERLAVQRSYDIIRNLTILNDVLSEYSISPEDIAIITHREYAKAKKKYQKLSELLDGTFGVNRMEYLMCDAKYTAVPVGKICLEEVVPHLLLKKKTEKWCLMLDEKALNFAETLIALRNQLYYLVYLHPASRIFEVMLSRAIEIRINSLSLLAKKNDEIKRVEDELRKINMMTDWQLWGYLKEDCLTQNAISPKFILEQIKQVRPYKPILHARLKEEIKGIDNFINKLWNDPSLWINLEREVAEEMGVRFGEIIFDMAYPRTPRELIEEGFIVSRANGKEEFVPLMDYNHIEVLFTQLESRISTFGIYYNTQNERINENRLKNIFMKKLADLGLELREEQLKCSRWAEQTYNEFMMGR